MNAKKIILSTFYDLLQRQPISAISVHRIIQTAEVSKPTFYRHFYNKFDLLACVFEEILAPMREAGQDLSWKEALEQTFLRIEANRALFRSGFKTDDQLYLRDSIMRRILEEAVSEMLRRRGADPEEAQTAFCVKACAVGHTAAMCSFAADPRRQDAAAAAELLMGTLPHNIHRYFED